MSRGLLFLLALLASCAAHVRTVGDNELPLRRLNLAEAPPALLAPRIAQDAVTLAHISEGLASLETRSLELYRTLLAAGHSAGGHETLTQQQDEAVRGHWLAFLNYRSALLRLIAYHSSCATLSDESLKLRSCALGYGAAVTLVDKGVSVVKLFRSDADVRRKLNEPEPSWGIPAGVFDTVLANVTSSGNLRLLDEARDEFTALLPRMKELGVLDDPAYAWIPADAARKHELIRANAPGSWEGAVDTVATATSKAAAHAAYGVQSKLATLAGDLRFSSAPPRVPRAELDRLARELQPGDIILTRHDSYLSNGFLPGFWTHAILYVGTAADLAERGWTKRPSIQRHLAEYERKDARGHSPRVIEAVSEGVIANSLEESLGADYIAVLRPRLSDSRKADAVERAFTHLGKPYDFEFDFFSTDKLVCTEVVYRSYDEPLGGESLHLELVRVLGRDTYPAVQLVKQFARAWQHDISSGTVSRELEFVAFLDGPQRRDVQALIDSARDR